MTLAQPYAIHFSIITLLAALFFVNRFRHKKQKNKWEKELNDLKEQIETLEKSPISNVNRFIIEFFKEHKQFSKERYKTLSGQSQFEFSLEDSIESQSALLRAYYLKAELIALKWIDDDRKYWLSITKSLRQVFNNLGVEEQVKQLTKKDKEIKTLQKKVALLESIDLAEPTIAPNLVNSTFDNIKEINQSLNDASQFNQEKIDILNRLNTQTINSESYVKNINLLKTTLTDSEREIANLEDKIKALTNEIEFLKNLKTESQDIASDFDYEVIANAKFSLSDTNSEHGINQQIRLLRENNEIQRDFIVKLRNELSLLEKEVSASSHLTTDEMQEKLLEIENLEKLIAEFEHCIFSLESEVELLHEQLVMIEKSASQTDASTIESSTTSSTESSPSQQVHELNKMLESTMQMYGDQGVITEFAINAAKCEKLVDLLVVINASFSSLGVTAAFHMRTEVTHNKSFPSHFLNANEEKMITEEAMPKSGPQFNTGSKMFFWDKYISIIVGNFPKSIERKTQLVDSTSLLKNLISSEVKRIESMLINQRQQKTLQRLLSATQKELKDVDIQTKYHHTEFQAIVSSIHEQIEQVKQLTSLPPEASVILNGVLNESKVRAGILSNTGSIVSNGFKSFN